MRLEGVAKMGYYRTPDNATTQIMRRIEPKNPGERMVIGDPCCGEGIALKAVADYLKQYGPVISYGIEPDEKRAEAAKSCLDHVVKDGYENTSVTNQAFSLWWLNPPYDTAAGDDNEKQERKEVIFLRDTFKYIAPHGVLVCIIPQHVLRYISTILVNRFYDLTLERFDDTDYAVFKQVVVFGYRKPVGAAPGTREEKDFLASLAALDPADIPALDKPPKKIYYLPQGVLPKTFFGVSIDMGKVVNALPVSPVRRIVGNLVAPIDSSAKMGTPLVSLKPGQLANIIAAGALDGIIGEGENRHLLVGFTNKRKRVEVEQNDEGEITTIETIEYVSGARIFTADGRHISLTEDKGDDEKGDTEACEI